MIRRIQIENFKSLAKVDVKLGSFNVFIGTNASGKSNFFEAFRVLQGLALGFDVGEVLNGKPRNATGSWAGIRGGSHSAAFSHGAAAASNQSRFATSHTIEPVTVARHDIHLDLTRLLVEHEKVECEFDEEAGEQGFDLWYPEATLGASKNRSSILSNFAVESELPQEEEHAAARAVQNNLAQLLLPSFDIGVLRQYSPVFSGQSIGEDGAGFASVIQDILSRESSRSEFTSWLTELRPAEIDSVEVLNGANNDVLFAIRETGKRRPTPAPILSDGTLRFAATSAILYQATPPSILLLEEIENGIHPSRMRVLVEMLRTRSQATHCQIMATTHSPLILAWMTEAEHKHTFVCSRDSRSGTTSITPLSEIPRLVELARKGSLLDMFVEGWFEHVT